MSLLSDTQDGLGMIMQSQGNSPENPTTEAVQKAVDLVREQKDKGQIRRFTGNDYADDLAAGNIAVAQAYSGDVVQLQADNPDLHFVIPESGGDWFIDTMVIPYTTQNQKAAEAWINYVYDRPNYAKLVAFTQYVPVLSNMTDELNKIDPKLGSQPADQPAAGEYRQAEVLGRPHRRADARVQHALRRGHRRLIRWPVQPASNRQRSKIAPYLMILPALAYLGVFFVVPFYLAGPHVALVNRAVRCTCRR